MLAYEPQHLRAVDARHIQIEQNQIWKQTGTDSVLEQNDALIAIEGIDERHGKAMSLEGDLKQFEVTFVVIDMQNARHSPHVPATFRILHLSLPRTDDWNHAAIASAA